jgi:hypothetical protein
MCTAERNDVEGPVHVSLADPPEPRGGLATVDWTRQVRPVGRDCLCRDTEAGT